MVTFRSPIVTYNGYTDVLYFTAQTYAKAVKTGTLQVGRKYRFDINNPVITRYRGNPDKGSMKVLSVDGFKSAVCMISFDAGFMLDRTPGQGPAFSVQLINGPVGIRAVPYGLTSSFEHDPASTDDLQKAFAEYNSRPLRAVKPPAGAQASTVARNAAAVLAQLTEKRKPARRR